ncbi:hypothetical protein V6N11_054727 [Hibiscus sabdariffa]|uniref:Uncharacterized protein n=1 Tax=Hibiscus sabdariffa TaxID=183260 RepID=A0ABR2S4Z4_9ROSI
MRRSMEELTSVMVKFQSLGSSEIDDPKEFGILLPRLLHVSPPSRVGLGSRLFSHGFDLKSRRIPFISLLVLLCCWLLTVLSLLVNNKSHGDVPGNVLLTIEGVEANNVIIETIHLSLIQFTDAKTVSSARNALDGISILSFATQAYSDESRDHTISYPSLLATQAPGMPVASNVCQNPQSAPLYPRTDYAASVAIQAQPSAGQIPAWDPSPQARPPYGSVLGTVPGQAYQSSVVPAYMNAVPPAGSSPHSQPGASSMGMSPPEANVRPGGAPPPGQPPYFGQ